MSEKGPPAIVSALVEFLSAPSWSAIRRVLEEHPEILRGEGDVILEKLALDEEDPDTQRNAEWHRSLLSRIRDIGIDAAFAEYEDPEGKPNLLLEYASRAQEARERFLQSNDLRDLDDEILARERMTHVPEYINGDQHLRLLLPFQMGKAYQDRYHLTGDIEELLRALQLWEQVVAQAPEDTPELATYLNTLGVGYKEHYVNNRESNTLEKAREAFSRAVELTSENSPERAVALMNMGITLITRYERTANQHELDEAIEAFEKGISLMPDDSPDLPGFLHLLATGLRTRYMSTGDSADIQRAAQAQNRSVALTPEGSPLLPGHLSGLGGVLMSLYDLKGELSDLEGAVVAFENALDLTPEDSPDRQKFVNNLATGFLRLYTRNGEPAHLDKAILCFEEVVAGFSADKDREHISQFSNLLIDVSPEPWKHHSNLGAALLTRYHGKGDQADLEKAFKALEEAVDLTLEDSPDRQMSLSNLGAALNEMYDQTGQLSYLERAIEVQQQALELTPKGSPDRPQYLSNLGSSLLDEYSLAGKRVSLERAISAFEHAVDLTPENSPFKYQRLSNLGSALRSRYSLAGELSDIEKAIEFEQRAVDLAPIGSPDLPTLCTNLGFTLRERYGRTLEVGDLARSVDLSEQAVGKASENSPSLPLFLQNLGAALVDRFKAAGETTDLEKAIQVLHQAVVTTHETSPELPSRLNSLGAALLTQYVRIGNLDDLNMGLKNFEQAVIHTPADSPDLPTWLNNLGAGLLQRARHLRDKTSLTRAIDTLKRAVEHTPEVSPQLSVWLTNLGTCQRKLHSLTGDLEDLKGALKSFERVWSLHQSSFAEASLAYKLGQQEQSRSLDAQLIEALLLLGQEDGLYQTHARRRAMEITEGSKSRLLTELMGRADISAPLTIPSELAARERELVSTLTTLDTAELATHGIHSTGRSEISSLNHLQERQQRFSEIRDLWQTMEAFSPEAKEYIALRRGDSLGWADLGTLADDLGRRTTILSLFTTGARTLLFALAQGYEQPKLAEVELDERGWDSVVRRFLREVHGYDGSSRRRETWDLALHPLLKHVAEFLEGTERIILVPHGLGHLIPWSVVVDRAGLVGRDGNPLPLVTLPALAVLPGLRSRRAGIGTGALVVGNPTGDLKGAERESIEVASMLGVEAIIGPRCTKARVLDLVADASIVHLATHAYFDPDSALDSGILLADGVLTAREVMQKRIKADLLVLSACETGIAGSLGGDEMAGMAQAFLQAGARSLVVSLWSVDDPATAAFMSAFYSAQQSGSDKASAISLAMASLRSEKRWGHPYYWGAFLLMGDWS